MKDYKYILEPYKSSKSRYCCPSCNKANQFTRYVNIELNQYIDENVGICNRIEKCGYHLTPKEYFQRFNRFDNASNLSVQNVKPIAPLLNRYKEQIKTTYLESNILLESYERNVKNNFLIYLESLFGKEQMQQLKKEYLIGTSKIDNSRVDFFQVDTNDKIRQLKNIGYHPVTGKKKDVYFTFPKSKYPDYNLVQCFFGEHLLKRYPDKKVAIVESEKTAIIASLYIKEFIWLAAGNANGLNYEKTKVLNGREVILYPDLGQYKNWEKKIPSLNKNATYTISEVLEKKSTDEDKRNGLDLADYLIKTTVDNFRDNSNVIDKYDPEFNEEDFIRDYNNTTVFSEEYINKLQNLKEFFSNQKHIKGHVKINSAEIIVEPQLMIKSHLMILNSINNKKTLTPYLDRLSRLKTAIEKDGYKCNNTL